MHNRGYTLLEMVIVITLSTLVLAVVTDSILSFYRANTNTLEQAYQVDTARRGVDRMVKDIREAAYADDGSYPIVAMATSSFAFYSDIDADGSVERVRYFLEGTTLRRGISNATGTPPVYVGGEETTIVSQYSRNASQGVPVFRYFKKDGSEAQANASSTSISFVQVEVVVNVNPSRLPGEFTLRSSASLRNALPN